jgi:hypothetical protein
VRFFPETLSSVGQELRMSSQTTQRRSSQLWSRDGRQGALKIRVRTGIGQALGQVGKEGGCQQGLGTLGTMKNRHRGTMEMGVPEG